jgi:hypothetical protein
MVKRIPIAEAKRIAEKYGQSQVILLTYDKLNGITHMVTYGDTLSCCRQAAEGGRLIRAALGIEEAPGS